MMVGKQDVASSLPPMRGELDVLADHQDLEDIIRGVVNKHKECRADYDKIVDRFYVPGESVEVLCRRLYDFCAQNLPYRVESDSFQTLRTPAAILALGPVWGVDCKHYAGFVAGVLDAVNRKREAAGDKPIKWVYRFASYDPLDESPGHVFVVVRPGAKDIWIDPVLPYFDIREPAPFYHVDKNVSMSLVSISGVGVKEDVPQWINYGFDWQPPGVVAGIGADLSTAQKIGTGLLAVSPALAAVPVAGWIASGATAIVGGLLSLFGKKAETENNRKLYFHYMIGVLGGTPPWENKTGFFADFGHLDWKVDNVTPQQMDQAQAWFSVVLGVPIENQSDVLNLVESGQKYWSVKKQYVPDLRLGETLDIENSILEKAHKIAKSMDYGNETAGQWADMVAARVQTLESVDPQTLQGGGEVNPYNDLLTTTGDTVQKAGISPLLMLGVAGAGAFMLFGGKKKRVGAAKGVTVSPWLIGGLGMGALIFIMLRKSSSTPVSQPVYQPGVYQPGTGGGSGTNVWDAAPVISDTLVNIFDKIFGKKS